MVGRVVSRSTRMSRVLSLVVVGVLISGSHVLAGGKVRADRWEPKMKAFEKGDAKNAPPKDAVLFVGSSSIVGWNLKRWFPDLAAINRGFGGSIIAESIHFADRIVLPHKPRIVVLYAGDNDVAGGMTPQQVFDDFQAFVKVVHDALPRTRIVFVAIKPSIARWRLVAKMRAANALIRAHTRTDERLAYVDVDAPMLGDDGKPRAEFFKKDGLHLNATGYALWTKLLRPHLK